ncbi:MAG: hypothetical protein P8Y97_20715 [Candidatus Lokiarchaeota archaeon]
MIASCFMDWYTFKIYDMAEGTESILSYHALLGLHIVKEQFKINNIFSQNTYMPLFLQVFFIGVVFFSLLTLLFLKKIKNQSTFLTAEVLVLILNLYYIIVFPSFYVLPNNLYFPFLNLIEPNFQMRLTYNIGLGYLFQVFGFLLIFPLTLYSFQGKIIREKKKEISVNLKEILMETQDNSDLEKLIDEERTKLMNSRTEGLI